MRDLEASDWFDATVPSSIFTNLTDIGQINEAELKSNPERFEWVSEKRWIFKKIFDVSQQILDSLKTEIVFDGLDTITHIWLNGKLIRKTNNMFIPHRLDVTGLLRARSNHLLVKFDSALDYGRGLMNRYGKLSENSNSYPSRAYVRKAQYQFGWDWAPALPGCGIFRPVRLEAFRQARIEDICIRTIDCNEKFADIRIAAKLDRLSTDDFICNIALANSDKQIQAEHCLHFKKNDDFNSAVVRIKNPQLWWPRGYGDQPLYTLAVQLFCGEQLIDRTEQKVGIRIVKLNQSKDEFGRSFQFEINGRAIYAKGANWVPMSIFAGSATDADYEKLITFAANANMNMLRVWGGGYYENPKFYELCDELGLMVWQDFAFACAYYPDRNWFLKDVKTEAKAVIKRLRNYCSIVLWCGNNENDWLHSIGELGTGRKFYGKAIYHKLLPGLLRELAPDVDYIPTTPLGPDKDMNSPDTGSIHQWQLWGRLHPSRNYRCPADKVPRFVTEFGFQSLPSIETINICTQSKQRHISDITLEKHNYQIDGNSRLHYYISEQFGKAKTLKDFIYISQLTQARAAQLYVEHLRAHNFRNSGTLFWQLNDACPAITFSAIDYLHQPKALYYYARRFFAPVLLTIVPNFRSKLPALQPELESAFVHVINDTLMPLTARVICRLVDLSLNTLDEVTSPLSINPFSSSNPFRLPNAFIAPKKPQHSFIYLCLVQDGRTITENSFFYLPDKYIAWPKPEITTKISAIDEQKWELKLASEMAVKDLRIATECPSQLSNNFISLLGREEKTIQISYPDRKNTPEPKIEIFSVNSFFQN